VIVASPPSAVQVGDIETVGATVTNHGTAPAGRARVGYLVSEGIEVLAITGPAVEGCTPGELLPLVGLVLGTCELGTLDPGATTTVTMRLSR
jgi:hypothetical protein